MFDIGEDGIGGMHAIQTEIDVPAGLEKLKVHHDYLIASEVLRATDETLMGRSIGNGSTAAEKLKSIFSGDHEAEKLIDRIVDRQTTLKYKKPNDDFRRHFQSDETICHGESCVRASRLTPLMAFAESSSGDVAQWEENFAHMRLQEDKSLLPVIQGGTDWLPGERRQLSKAHQARYKQQKKTFENNNMRGHALQFVRLGDNTPDTIKMVIQKVFKTETEILNPSLTVAQKERQAEEFAAVKIKRLKADLATAHKTAIFPEDMTKKNSQEMSYNSIQHLLDYQFPMAKDLYHSAHRVPLTEKIGSNVYSLRGKTYGPLPERVLVLPLITAK